MFFCTLPPYVYVALLATHINLVQLASLCLDLVFKKNYNINGTGRKLNEKFIFIYDCIMASVLYHHG
jgi:hypothetical protein